VTTPDLTSDLMLRLLREQVDFVVIGGVAAVLHGAAYVTRDLDIAAPINMENVSRLWRAIGDLHPRWAIVPKHPLVAEPIETLATFKNLYLLTDLGRLDVLGEIPPIDSYETLRASAVRMAVGSSQVSVISIDHLLRIKESLPRPQDRLVAEQLRAIRQRPRRSPEEPTA